MSITLISFLAYFVMSGMLSSIGIITGPMASYFELPVTEVTARFSWLTLGILVGSILALVVFDWLSLKKIVILLYGLISCSLVSLLFAQSIDFVGYALGVVGVCCGVGLAGAATIISTTYEQEQRASMLVITDGSFSVAGIVCSSIALYLLSLEFHWSGSYLFVAIVAAIIIVLSIFSTFPDSSNPVKNGAVDAAPVKPKESEPQARWPFSVWVCIACLFFYTLGQYSMLWWLPNHLETALGIQSSAAGEVVGRFWTGMFVAQLFVAWWVLKVGVQRLLLLATLSTFLCSIPLWLVDSIDALVKLAFLWGFANLGLLKILISYATLQVPKPGPRLISGLLLGATLGTALSPWVTSNIVEMSSSYFVLQFSTLCYALLTIMLWILRFYEMKKAS